MSTVPSGSKHASQQKERSVLTHGGLWSASAPASLPLPLRSDHGSRLLQRKRPAADSAPAQCLLSSKVAAEPAVKNGCITSITRSDSPIVSRHDKRALCSRQGPCAPSVGCITRTLSVRWDGRSLGCRQTPCQAAMSQSIAGEYDSRKDHCGCGYEAVWSITENGDEIIVQEQPG